MKISCLTYEILLQHSGLAPKPNDGFPVFEIKEGDEAIIVRPTERCCVFHNGKWELKENENESIYR